MTRFAGMQRKMQFKESEPSGGPPLVPQGREKWRRVWRLITFWKRLARPLLGGDGFDDELAAILGIKGHFRAVKGQIHKVLHFRVVEDSQGFESQVPHDIALALKTPLRVRELGSLQETERHPAGKQHDGENRQRGLVVRPETDYQTVVVVIDHFDRAGQALAQFDEHLSCESLDGGIVLDEKRIELLFWTSRELGLCFHG